MASDREGDDDSSGKGVEREVEGEEGRWERPDNKTARESESPAASKGIRESCDESASRCPLAERVRSTSEMSKYVPVRVSRIC